MERPRQENEESEVNMTTKEKPTKKYLQRPEQFILKPISSDKENDRAAEVLDEMLESFDSPEREASLVDAKFVLHVRRQCHGSTVKTLNWLCAFLLCDFFNQQRK